MSTAGLNQALRAWACGLLPDEAGVELLISNGSFLTRRDFRDRFIRLSAGTAHGEPEIASIDWQDTIAALDAGELPCSGGEQRILRLAASLADGTPVSLRDAVTGIDQRNTALLITAILHATGTLPYTT
jgi:hypothetical protein